MGKKHQDGTNAGRQNQPPGRRRGPETGNGTTASTGHGRPNRVVNRDPNPPDGQSGILGFLWRRPS